MGKVRATANVLKSGRHVNENAMNLYKKGSRDGLIDRLRDNLANTTWIDRIVSSRLAFLSNRNRERLGLRV